MAKQTRGRRGSDFDFLKSRIVFIRHSCQASFARLLAPSHRPLPLSTTAAAEDCLTQVDRTGRQTDADHVSVRSSSSVALLFLSDHVGRGHERERERSQFSHVSSSSSSTKCHVGVDKPRLQFDGAAADTGSAAVLSLVTFNPAPRLRSVVDFSYYYGTRCKASFYD